MHAAIAALAETHALPAEVARDFDALLAQLTGRSVVTTLVQGYQSVDVDGTWMDGEADLLPAGDHTEEAPLVAGRYADLGPIGMGGMGEVHRVRDLQLNRTLAMKIVHTSLLQRPSALARFLEEAQATAQLQHPNIVPVHDIGTLDDGRVWFTMKEVRGRTLAEVADEVHQTSDFRWNPGRTGWTFKRVIASFLGVCHAIAYAHERGVVHRDLKPDNVMVGRHGETYVLDWGLAKIIGRPMVLEPGLGLDEREHTIVVGSGSHHTQLGTVAGTPAYMAPEQARGEVHRIDARTDVYALGAMLYELLSGRMPYEGRSPLEVVGKVQDGPPPPVTDHVAIQLPDELVAACERAMARDPDDRFPSALDLADEVEAWLDGARKREQALAITERALTGVDEAAAMLAQADALQAEGDAFLQDIEPWRPAEEKAPGWRRQDEATALRRAAELKQLEVDQGLHGALRVAPNLPESHAALAERYRARHARAEDTRREDEAARAETLTRFHAEALPAAHPVRAACRAYLAGIGALSLVTDPPGAEVMLHRYEERNRRLVEVPVRSLGTTPLHEVPLPMGSYLALVTHPERDPVRYPFMVPRQGHWDGVAPGDAATTPVWLPPRGYLSENEVYVPAGWFQSGGDPNAVNGQPARRLWCDALVIHRFPTTNRQYIAFLDDLVAQGRTDEALAHAPRERAGHEGELGALLYGFDGRQFSLRADSDGHLWLPEWPVTMADWHGAAAYLAWLAARTGRPWRLPGELEWEKAARGVDGRWFPWGDHCDPTWCHLADSHRGDWLPATVDRYPVDVSPSGMRGAGGNVEDMSADLWEGAVPIVDGRVVPPNLAPDAPATAFRMARGGYWYGTAKNARCATRGRGQATSRFGLLGFRGLFRLTEPTS